MPYIEKKNRALLDAPIDEIVGTIQAGDNPDGEANYTITRIVAGAFKPATGKWRYAAIARVVGCFVCAMLEFYFRVARGYEDQAIAKNGDVKEYES